jgi:uncharacterized protein (TIGR00299 family) protein
MRILYFDPILGVSGDMILAALIDCGVPREYLRKMLAFVPNFRLKVSPVKRHGVSAKTVTFDIKRQIKADRFIPMIDRSRLSADIKAGAMKIINRIFSVERKVHRTRRLHLHELADADTLLDIVGALVAIDYLKIKKIFSKPVKAGQGFIKTAEGNMPAFNFATAELLKGFPVDFLPVPAELTTPTGAAIIGTIAEPHDSLSINRIQAVGLGAGTMNIKDYPNLLRIFFGEIDNDLSDECIIIETNIDDMNPQDYDVVIEKLYKVGALEVFLTPIMMKQSRPGILLTVLCKENKERIVGVLLDETTTLGVRVRRAQRYILPREIVTLKSPYGTIRVKKAKHGNKTKLSLEYRDVKRIAQRKNLSMSVLRNELMRFVEKKRLK